jgi:hypothetical protein
MADLYEGVVVHNIVQESEVVHMKADGSQGKEANEFLKSSKTT